MIPISIEDLIIVWNLINEKKNYSINIEGDDLEFHFENNGIDEIIDFLKQKNLINNSGSKFFSIKRRNEDHKIYFFKDTRNLFTILRADVKIFNNYDLFVFDHGESYLFHDCKNKETISNSTLTNNTYLFDHYLSYTRLLTLFRSNIPLLVELDRTISSGNELIIISKGAEKFITAITYIEVDNSIFYKTYSRIPIEEFKLKLINQEWVSSFKNNLCQFMELQNDVNRTFGTLYENFSYLINQTERDYQLFISKFSFDKIRKQFKTEKNIYFEALATAQDKISSQVISIPISIGASIFSFYQLPVSRNILILIYIGIIIYSIFITYLIKIYLSDISKLEKDIKEEQKNLIEHFSSLHEDFKDDFDYMRSKRKSIRILGYSIIIALAITIITIARYLILYKIQESTIKYNLI